MSTPPKFVLPPPVEIWGLPLAPVTFDQTLDAVENLIDAGKPSIVITANLNYAMVTASNPALDRVNRSAAFVVTDGALPAAHPVAYLLDREQVVFRTAKGSTLTVATRQKVVAFEVDRIDVDTRTGWSVLGVGEAGEIVDPARLADLDGRLPDLWSPLAGAHVLAVPLQKLSGRRLRPADPPVETPDGA